MSLRTWIRGGRIITPDQTIDESVVVIENGRVAAIEAERQMAATPPGVEVVDAEGALVIPGLIDIHVHGGAGSDTMDATPEALDGTAAFFLRHGVTSYLATTITQSTEAIDGALQALDRHPSKPGEAQRLGAHLEGPYLSQKYRGAQPSHFIRNPDPAEYRRWLKTGLVRLMTVAPEAPGALELIREGVEQGIRFSAGHTEATYAQVEAAAEAGLSQSTHTFNGMTGLHHRDPGTVGAVLSDERIYAELIADGFHVHPAVLRLAVRAKGVERTILVTDAIRAAGMADGQYDLGGEMVTVQGGMARTHTGSLAGSTLTLNVAVRNMMEFAALSIHQAVAMATTTPAAALGLAGHKGALRPGADADIALVDPQMNVKAVWVGGARVF